MAGGKLKSGRKHTKSKGKRWKKGQSSSSNPQTKKHRDEAKNRFFNQNSGPSNLTVDALRQHDRRDDEDEDDTQMLDDAQSVGGRTALTAATFSTWATNWTECTNRTFGRVHRYWASNSALHKEILAVLAAVTEVIKAHGGKESETEYFAALMTTLDTVDTDESLAAVAYLLSLAIKRVPPAVLKTKFSEVSKSLMNILAQHSKSETPALLRSVLVCVASLLRVQEQAAWSNTSTTTVYTALLTYTIHSKPKVRKAAQHAVSAILKGSTFMTQGAPPAHHPAAAITAKFCIQQIEDCGGTGEASGSLRALGILKDVLSVFPQHSLKSSCEAILKVMTLSNVVVTAVAMSALHNMFVCQPKASNLPAELNAQLITALYDYQPGENDAQPMCAWIAVMEKAHNHLKSLDFDLCLSHLPRLFSSCMSVIQSQKPNVATTAATCLITLLRECVAPSTSRLENPSTRDVAMTAAQRMFSIVAAGLSYQYFAAWGLILKVIAVLFEVLGKDCHKMMRKCLSSMADLRASHRFAYTAELDHAMGVAVQTMGPRVVLAAVPLQITGNNDDLEFPRSWLLPVLRDNVKNTELAFFTEYFLPLAAKLSNKCAELTQSKELAAAKAYSTLQLQIWSLLAGFCNQPTDLAKAFKGIARILGSALSERPDLRLQIMSALRKLVTHSLEDEESKSELSRFSKNYIPILFNLFTSEIQDTDPTRLAVLETIKVFLQVTPPQLVATFHEKCSSKLSDMEIGTDKKHALMDLCICMVPYLKTKDLSEICTFVISQLETTDKTLQKKSYRILEEVCRADSKASKDFVTSHLGELQTVLLKSLSSSSASSKAPRLRCLVNIFKQLEQPQADFLTAVIPEAILCIKEVAERARAAAFSLLVEMGDATIRWSEQSRRGAIEEYVNFMLAGLSGDPHMVATTTLGLGHVLHHYKDDVSSELLAVVMDNLNSLLSSKSREVVQSALALVKIIVTVFKDMSLGQFLDSLVSNLVSMKEDSRRHFRFKTKEIFERLIRKFGHETIQRMVPDSMQKMLSNIRKTQERVKRKKQQQKEAGDEEDADHDDGVNAPLKSRSDVIQDILRDTDSELEDDDKEKTSKRSKLSKKVKRSDKSGGAWLKESMEGDIVDFLDSSVSKQVLATKPLDSKHKRSEDKFKTSSDGRLIISEDGQDDPLKGKKRKKKEDPVLDDVDEILDAMGAKKSKKRKSIEDVDDENDEPAPTYKAGGSGIHRPLDKPVQKKPQDFGGEFRAKKAGGDIKKKGQQDPYAYVPLNMQNLNRRKKAKAAGMFKNLVKGAKRGAAKGKGHRPGQAMRKMKK